MNDKERNESRGILIVDDDTWVGGLLREYLESLGVSPVDVVEEREEAETLLSFREYRLVICDLQLTKSNAFEGLGLVDFARSHQPEIKTLVYTGNPSPEVRVWALESGADGYLVKPAALAELGAEVTRLLAGRVASDAASGSAEGSSRAA